jgi:hypothetical protein
MSWIKTEAPAAPKLVAIKGNQGDGVLLQWKDTVATNSSYYVVYRFDKDEPLDIDNPSRIMAIVQRKPYAIQSWVDKQTRKRTGYTYAVTAADRLHNESAVGKPVTIKTRGKRRLVVNN